MSEMRVTLITITAKHAARPHQTSFSVGRRVRAWVKRAHPNTARETSASDEQAGRIKRKPELSANPTVFPTRSVPTIRLTKIASACKIQSLSIANTNRLQNIGTVIARMTKAARRAGESSRALLPIGVTISRHKKAKPGAGRVRMEGPRGQKGSAPKERGRQRLA